MRMVGWVVHGMMDGYGASGSLSRDEVVRGFTNFRSVHRDAAFTPACHDRGTDRSCTDVERPAADKDRLVLRAERASSRLLALRRAMGDELVVEKIASPSETEVSCGHGQHVMLH